MSIRRQEALDYHAQGRPGKIQVSPTKPFKNQRDLSLAYTPGVAEPCREIAARPEEAYAYTAKGNYPFSRLRGPANMLIFPNLDAANISYKLLSRVGGAEAIGPILVGMAQPVHVLQRGSDVNDIVNMAVIAAVDAQEHGRRPRA